MKKILLLISITCIQVSLLAQTNINSSPVAGHWTLAGSPYIINVNIAVAGGTTLTIDAGVVVKFVGLGQFDIAGSLIAHGTAANRIVFEANDTTGWYNDMATSGGWHGIHFNQFSGTVDSTVFVNCDIKDCKHGVPGNWNGIEALFLWRNIKIDSCNIYHCQSNTSSAEGVTVLIQGGAVEMSHCRIHDCDNRVCALRIGTGNNDYIKITDSRIDHNTGGGCGIWIITAHVLFERNEVDNNTGILYDGAALKVTGDHVVIRHCKIHHNQSENEAAICCFLGKIDIDGNLICNNWHTNGNCGLVDGGGGIHVMLNNAGAFDSTFYLIRNNVIANNYSAYYGGGIYVYNTRAEVMNNHIINNGAWFGGGGIFALGSATIVNMFNNIFKNNQTFFWNADSADVYLFPIYKMSYNHNWAEFRFKHNVRFGGTGVIVAGDTAHNVIGNDPMLLAPTINCTYTEDATAAFFGLNTGSPCIDAGDTTGCFHTQVDYSYNTRLQGWYIDIGAFEVDGWTWGITQTADSDLEIHIYPNPASNEINFVFPNEGNHDVTITDLFGREVLHEKFSIQHPSLNIQNLSSGIYFAGVKTLFGSKTYKFVKQ